MAVVAVKEAPFLRPVDRIIGRIEIQDARDRWCRVRLHKPVDEQAIHGVVIDRDLLVARRVRHGRAGQFQPIERALAGATRREVRGVREDGHQRIVARRDH